MPDHESRMSCIEKSVSGLESENDALKLLNNIKGQYQRNINKMNRRKKASQQNLSRCWSRNSVKTAWAVTDWAHRALPPERVKPCSIIIFLQETYISINVQWQSQRCWGPLWEECTGSPWLYDPYGRLLTISGHIHFLPIAWLNIYRRNTNNLDLFHKAFDMLPASNPNVISWILSVTPQKPQYKL